MDIRLALMTGIDIPIPELKLVIHQPTIKEISYMGEDDFFTGVHYLCLDKTALIQDESLLESLTNFQVLMKVLEQSQEHDVKAILKTLLSLYFPAYSITITPNGILFVQMVGEQINTVTVDNNNFEFLQRVVKEIACIHSLFQNSNITYNPGNAKAREIMQKIMRGRQRAAELKAQNKESILTRYLSILTIGVASMSLQDCLELTLFQLFDLVERYNHFVEWDIDLKVRLAGGTPKSEVENWMKNIH